MRLSPAGELSAPGCYHAPAMDLNERPRRLTGAGPAVAVSRDSGGVVHVEAARFEDLPFGLGWAHAHDRLVQMMLVRTVGRGEAAEHLAATPEMLDADRFMRRMGFRRNAREQAARLSEETRRWCDSYCRGVNEYLATERRPLELFLAGYRPDGWSPEDILLTIELVSYMGLAQSQQLFEKFLVQSVLSGVPLERLSDLFGPHLAGFDPAWLDGVRVTEPLAPPEALREAGVPIFKASNNWVLAGSRTASGKPIYANDPHLECDRLPAVWCEAVLVSGDSFLIGASIPGIPGVLIGRNERCAWGVTYGFMDQVDYFVEECRDGRFRRGDEWVEFETRQETIRLKGGGEQRIAVSENLHGVLEGDPSVAGRYLCRAWSGHKADVARTAGCLVGLAKARTADEAALAVRDVNISLNWIVCDVDGNIGYQQSGLMPKRCHGWSGLYPAPGWDPKYDWKGWVDPSELHHLSNPPEGYLASANEDLNPPGGPLAINMPMGDYRARRIREVLGETSGATVDTMRRLQMDLLSLQAKAFMPWLLPLLPATAEGRAFAAWDCRYDADSTHPGRFEAIYRELTALVFGDGGFGRPLVDFMWDESVVMTDFYARFDRVLLDPSSIWWSGRSREEVARKAIAAAFSRPARTWRELRQIVMRNLFFGGKLPAWLGFDHGPVHLAGNRATVLQGAIYKSLGRPTTFAPSLRFITDLATREAHTALAGGPSGRRTSRWYTSDVPRWLDGTLKTVKP